MLDIAKRKYVAWLCIPAFFVLLVFHPVFPSPDRFFDWQAKSFLAGRLDIARSDAAKSNFVDMTLHDGRLYLPLGPLPSLLITPFIALGTDLPVDAWLHVVLGIAAAVLSYRVARRFGLDREPATWMAAAFTFTSSAVGVIFLDGPWYFAHVIVLILGLLAVLEHKGKDRPLVIGSLLALVMATRLTAAAGIVFFVVLTAYAKIPPRSKLRRIALMAVPMLIVGLGLGWFNAARFGSPFENGYGAQIGVYGTRAAKEKAIYGMFDFHYVANNVRYYFFQGPVFRDGRIVASIGGLGLLFVAPIFLLVLSGDPKDREWLAGMAVTAIVLSIFLCYYGTGASQFGPRFINDALPFLYVALLRTVRKADLGWWKRWLIFGGACANLALLVLTYR